MVEHASHALHLHQSESCASNNGLPTYMYAYQLVHMGRKYVASRVGMVDRHIEQKCMICSTRRPC